MEPYMSARCAPAADPAPRNVPDLVRTPGPASAVRGVAISVLEASQDCIKYVELDGTLTLMNANGLCAMQIDDFADVDGKEWASLWPDDAADAVRRAVVTAAAGGSDRFQAFCPTAKGEPRWWDVTVTPVPDDDGEPIGILSVSRDVTESVRDREALARAKDEVEVALREVNHRVKNLFALVPAILQMSARAVPDVPTLVERVRERIGALARSHTLTLNAFSEDHGVSLDALVRAVLEPYLDRAESFSLSGPSVRLAARDANTVALTLHELATNAAKHGALSDGDGRVAIVWSARDRGEGGGPGRLDLRWTEADGPAVGGPPERKGFGTRLVDRLLEAHGGEVDRSWDRDGLSVRMAVPLHSGAVPMAG